jgi:hypothetical protein
MSVCAPDARPDSPKPIDAPRPDADFTPPSVFATNPIDGATGVSRTTTVRVQFTEPVFNVTTTTFRVTDGATPANGTIASIDPLTFVFTPTLNFNASSGINVVLANGIMDAAGNALMTTSFSFSTGLL